MQGKRHANHQISFEDGVEPERIFVRCLVKLVPPPNHVQILFAARKLWVKNSFAGQEFFRRGPVYAGGGGPSKGQQRS